MGARQKNKKSDWRYLLPAFEGVRMLATAMTSAYVGARFFRGTGAFVGSETLHSNDARRRNSGPEQYHRTRARFGAAANNQISSEEEGGSRARRGREGGSTVDRASGQATERMTNFGSAEASGKFDNNMCDRAYPRPAVGLKSANSLILRGLQGVQSETGKCDALYIIGSSGNFSRSASRGAYQGPWTSTKRRSSVGLRAD
jgi:hypothetical protein